MPAPVPAGFTRGALVATGGHESFSDTSTILQYFWQLAGSFGARIAIIPTASRDFGAAEQVRALFARWGVNWVELLPIRTRLDARSADAQAVIQHATAYFFTDGNPLRLSTVLGGTPVAQAIRRGHARGKVVAGSGHAGAFLAEHMIAHAEKRPTPERGIVRFAPGLGLTNRVIFVADYTREAWYGPLCVAVAANPFLLGVGIHANAAVVLHPGNLLEGVGAVAAALANGSGITHTNLYEVPFGQSVAIEGIEFQQLPHDHYYNIDQRGLHEEENILAEPARSSF
ncbi:MAG: cyanophycinase [Anaerolineae bacterium]